MSLRNDFKDEILQEGELHRIYNIRRKSDNEIVESEIYLEKAYTPLQEGDEFGANEVNEIVNRFTEDEDLINNNTGLISNLTEQLSIESGTWTPALQNCTYNLTVNNSNYYKIGNLCYIQSYMTGTIKSVTSDGRALIKGLPFTVKRRSDISIGMLGRCVENITGICAVAQQDFISFGIGDGSTYIGGITAKWKINSGNTFYISFSGIYEIGE